MIRFVDCEQHSHEWWSARLGRITSSRICDVMAKLKSGGEAAPRRNYRTELLCERLTGNATQHYVTPAMEWGTNQESFARTAYELATDTMVDPVGFVFHGIHDFTGGSPDALVGDDGLIEIKCPTTANHLTWMVDGKVPEQHEDQIQWNLACTGRPWGDFVSFDSRLPHKLQLFIVRLPRDEGRIAQIEREVITLHNEVEYLAAELGVETILPPIDSFLDVKSKRTVKIGAHDVPADIAEMLADEIVP